jgi:hypothetical protein
LPDYPEAAERSVTRRERKDMRWIVAAFVIVIAVACGGWLVGAH